MAIGPGKKRHGAQSSDLGEKEVKALNQLRVLLKRGPEHKTWGRQLNALREQTKRFGSSQAQSAALLVVVGRALGTEAPHSGRHQEALQFYQEAALLNPKSLSCAYHHGIALYRTKDFKAAAAVYQEALEAHEAAQQAGEAGDSEESEEEEVPVKARVWVNLGVALEAQGRVKEALRPYRQALSIHASYPAALKLLGSGLLAMDELSEAESSLQRALSLKPVFPDALCDLGACRRRLKDSKGALQALTLATQQNPKHSIAFWNLSHAQRDCGLYQQAVQSCDKVLALESSLWVAHCHRALLLAVMRKTSQARSDLNHAKKKSQAPPEDIMEAIRGLLEEEDLQPKKLASGATVNFKLALDTLEHELLPTPPQSPSSSQPSPSLRSPKSPPATPTTPSQSGAADYPKPPKPVTRQSFKASQAHSHSQSQSHSQSRSTPSATQSPVIGGEKPLMAGAAGQSVSRKEPRDSKETERSSRGRGDGGEGGGDEVQTLAKGETETEGGRLSSKARSDVSKAGSRKEVNRVPTRTMGWNTSGGGGSGGGASNTTTSNSSSRNGEENGNGKRDQTQGDRSSSRERAAGSKDNSSRAGSERDIGGGKRHSETSANGHEEESRRSRSDSRASSTGRDSERDEVTEVRGLKGARGIVGADYDTDEEDDDEVSSPKKVRTLEGKEAGKRVVNAVMALSDLDDDDWDADDNDVDAKKGTGGGASSVISPDKLWKSSVAFSEVRGSKDSPPVTSCLSLNQMRKKGTDASGNSLGSSSPKAGDRGVNFLADEDEDLDCEVLDLSPGPGLQTPENRPTLSPKTWAPGSSTGGDLRLSTPPDLDLPPSPQVLPRSPSQPLSATTSEEILDLRPNSKSPGAKRMERAETEPLRQSAQSEGTDHLDEDDWDEEGLLEREERRREEEERARRRQEDGILKEEEEEGLRRRATTSHIREAEITSTSESASDSTSNSKGWNGDVTAQRNRQQEEEEILILKESDMAAAAAQKDSVPASIHAPPSPDEDFDTEEMLRFEARERDRLAGIDFNPEQLLQEVDPTISQRSPHASDRSESPDAMHLNAAKPPAVSRQVGNVDLLSKATSVSQSSSVRDLYRRTNKSPSAVHSSSSTHAEHLVARSDTLPPTHHIHSIPDPNQQSTSSKPNTKRDPRLSGNSGSRINYYSGQELRDGNQGSKDGNPPSVIAVRRASSSGLPENADSGNATTSNSSNGGPFIAAGRRATGASSNVSLSQHLTGGSDMQTQRQNISFSNYAGGRDPSTYPKSYFPSGWDDPRNSFEGAIDSSSTHIHKRPQTSNASPQRSRSKPGYQSLKTAGVDSYRASVHALGSMFMQTTSSTSSVGGNAIGTQQARMSISTFSNSTAGVSGDRQGTSSYGSGSGSTTKHDPLTGPFSYAYPSSHYDPRMFELNRGMRDGQPTAVSNGGAYASSYNDNSPTYLSDNGFESSSNANGFERTVKKTSLEVTRGEERNTGSFHMSDVDGLLSELANLGSGNAIRPTA